MVFSPRTSWFCFFAANPFQCFQRILQKVFCLYICERWTSSISQSYWISEWLSHSVAGYTQWWGVWQKIICPGPTHPRVLPQKHSSAILQKTNCGKYEKTCLIIVRFTITMAETGGGGGQQKPKVLFAAEESVLQQEPACSSFTSSASSFWLWSSEDLYQ